jgi:hypothetical protein
MEIASSFLGVNARSSQRCCAFLLFANSFFELRRRFHGRRFRVALHHHVYDVSRLRLRPWRIVLFTAMP